MTNGERERQDKMVREYAAKGKKKQDEKQRIENLGWDLKFQKLVDYVTNAQNDMNRNFNLSQRLLDHVGKFREAAKEYVVKIVDEMHIPVPQRTYQPINFDEDGSRELSSDFFAAVAMFCDEDQNQKSDLIFYEKDEHNMIIKLTHPTDYIEFPMGEDEHGAHGTVDGTQGMPPGGAAFDENNQTANMNNASMIGI